ncbi:hypothetical protein FNH05_19540, partial [Amycolatopsis rhizosphaerae]
MTEQKDPAPRDEPARRRRIIGAAAAAAVIVAGAVAAVTLWPRGGGQNATGPATTVPVPTVV